MSIGPITWAMEALTRAKIEFSEHGLVTKDECQLCRRWIANGGLHAEDCTVAGIDLAIRRLKEFREQVL